MSTTPNAQLLAHTLVSNEISKRHQVRLQEKVAQDTAVAAVIPSVIQALQDNERIYPHQAEKVAAAIVNPVQCLELLRDVACHKNASEIEKIGSETGTPAPGAGASPHTGRQIADHNETPAGQSFSDAILGASAS
jgi:hypothetical protein